MSNNDELIGSWSLDSFELQSTDGSVTYPYGQDLTGYLFYNSDGFMSSAFMSAGRAATGDGELSQAAASNTYDQFMAYTGPYEVNGDKITHFVEVSSLEVWIGSVQERWFKIDGDRLDLLTAPLSVGSDAPVGRLTWSRVSRTSSTS